MRQKITNLLLQANLNKAEIAIYLHLLKHGQGLIPELVQKTQFNQMRVYRCIQSLQNKGLVELKALNNKQSQVIPLSLQNLIKKLAIRQRQLRRLELTLRQLLPVTNLNEDITDDIELKEGLDAFREEYLKIPFICKNEFLCLGSMVNYWHVAKLSYDCPEERYFIRKRLQNGIHARVLTEPCPESLDFIKFDSVDKRLTHLTENLPIQKNYLTITEQQISHFICDREHPQVIVIRQPDLVKLHHQQFQNQWKQTNKC